MLWGWWTMLTLSDEMNSFRFSTICWICSWRRSSKQLREQSLVRWRNIFFLEAFQCRESTGKPGMYTLVSVKNQIRWKISNERMNQCQTICSYLYCCFSILSPLIFLIRLCYLCTLRSDYEFVVNYKLLQAAFSKNNVQRFVDVPKLIRAKYQGE